MPKSPVRTRFMVAAVSVVCHFSGQPSHAAASVSPTPSLAVESLQSEFVTPPAAARPWVYWYFMDGNLSREGITADLEAMKKAGIGGAIFLEVNLSLIHI